MMYIKKAPISLLSIIVGGILVLQSSSVSGQNFNDPETISSWSITTQLPLNATTNVTPEQGFDMWNI